MIDKSTFGQYQILEEIHDGTMSYLYKVQDTQQNRIVALKVLKQEYSYEPELIERFQREAKVAQSLVHPNIIKVFDIGCENNYYYFTMQYINGPSLRKVMEKENPLPVNKACTMIKDICLGLNYAHNAKVFHRDIKPSNIMLDEKDNIIICDFGIAKVAYLANLTQRGVVLGTWEYTSPEQIRGNVVDGRADLYSVGIVLYEMLTGSPPYKGRDFWEIADRIIKETPQKPSELNKNITKEIDDIVFKAIEKDRTMRFATGLEMVNALNNILGLPLEQVKVESTPQIKKEQVKQTSISQSSQKLSSSTKNLSGSKIGKGLWLPPVIALCVLLIIGVLLKAPQFLPVVLIVAGIIGLLFVFDVFKTPKKTVKYSYAKLLHVSGNDIMQSFPLNNNEVIIGRDQPDGIEIFKDTISRSHARVRNEYGYFVIYDLNSKNATYVNNKKIDRYVLKNKDHINIGDEILIFQGVK
jgi:eukaryotic-like serine/threonine-protein kinase